MKWTPENIEKTKNTLRNSRTVGLAMAKIRVDFGPNITFDAVRRAFHRNRIGNPRLHIGRNLEPVEIIQSYKQTSPYGGIVTLTVPKGATSMTIERSLLTINRSTKRILVVSDLHAPYHDKAAWECLLEVIRETKPETIVIIGDAADCYAISSHPKSLKRKADFATEVELVKKALAELRAAAGKSCRILWTEGNHEDRITRYLQSKAPEFGQLKELSAQELFKVSDFNIEWVPYRTSIKIGNCSFTHDVGRCGVNTARQSLLDFGGNIVVGHSHRGGVSYQGEIKGSSHFCLNVGWLGDVNEIDYVHRNRALRDWQLGFGIVDQDEQHSWATFVPMVNGQCVVDGIRYGKAMAA